MLMLVRAVGLDRPRFRLLLGAGLLLLLIDLALIGGKTSGAPLIVSGAAAVALAWFAALHPRWTTAAAGTATALSLAVTVLLNQTFHQPTPGVLEHLGLLLLLALVCRRSSALGIALAVPAVALAAGVLRTRTLATFFSYDEVVTVVFLLLTFAVANGFSLRSEDRRRVEQVAAARRAERLELARDLHDDVAHHVTAIVVLAQAGQELVRETEFPLRGLFRDVERTGQEGLVSMGRMVAFLRDASDPAAATRHPREEIGTIREQAERFSRTGPPVEVDERPGVAPRRWPPDVATSIGRLVQEGLTNVGKHAPSCTGVRVVVEMTDGALMVSMRNDGSGRRRRAVRSSGHGLTGLAERFDALGGRLTWGETIEGLWELSASVPVNSGDKEGHDVDQRADRR